MKKLITFAFLFFVSYTLQAQQAPNVISYQGLIQGVNGSRVIDSTYPITVILWSDADGATPIWQDVFQAKVQGGVFNILLGSQTPLPSSQVMDHPLWISVSLGEFSEASQRSRLSTVPMAINVADSSITAQKMATDYVSGVTIDGTQITGRGGALNFQSGEGVQFQFDSSSNSVTANVPLAQHINPGFDAWGEGGNYGTAPGTNYIGTSDSFALEIHVNNSGFATDGNGRVMRYEPMLESPNVIGGYNGNLDSASTYGGNVIAGGGSLLHPNKVVIDFSTVGGGAGNTAINGGTIAGGGPNTAQEEAFIGGGDNNYAGYLAVVSGGLDDTAKYYGAVVSGGILNESLDTLATVSGGTGNTATTLYSTVGGGSTNLASGYASTVAGGLQNGATGLETAIGGGYLNSADTLSAIPGGYRLQLSKNSFGFNAGGSGSETTLSDTNVAFFGNVNLWIANSDNTARQLRLYGPNTDADFGDHSQPYTSFEYNSTATIHYIFPVSPGGTDQVLTNDGTGQLFWGAAVGTGQWSITGNHGTTPPANFLGTTDSNSLELHVFDSGSTTYGAKRVMRYEVNDTSANIIGGYHANAVSGTHLVGVTIAGGGLNGHPNVAKGSYAVIAGGRRNTDTAFAFVGGGDSNLAMGAYSAVVGGTINVASGNSAIVSGGTNNIASGLSATVGGGSGNTAFGHYSGVLGGIGNRAKDSVAMIVGGYNNLDSGINSTIAGGIFNQILSNRGDGSNYAFIGAGDFDTIYVNAFGNTFSSAIVAGQGNKVGAANDIIGSGMSNDIEGVVCFIGSGTQNTIVLNTQNAVIAGGSQNIDSSSLSSILGGDHNTIGLSSPGQHVIAGGSDNTITGFGVGNSIGGGDNNYSNGNLTTIPGGDHLSAQSYAQTVVGYYNKTQGTSTGEPAFGGVINSNDRGFIVGNGQTDTEISLGGGLFRDSSRRSNAFEVMNKGTSIVYCTNGSGGATPGGTHPPVIDSAAIYGGRYRDNTNIAWGDIQGFDSTSPLLRGRDTVFSDFGVKSVAYQGVGQYLVTLNIVDPYTGSAIGLSGYSVTATTASSTSSHHTCLIASIDPVPGATPAQFTIWINDPTNHCSTTDARVMFQVFGRK